MHALLQLRPVPALVAEMTVCFDAFVLYSFMPFWRYVDSAIGTDFDSIVHRLRLDDVLIQSRRFSQQRE